MQKQTLMALSQAIKDAKAGIPTGMLCYSNTVRKDIAYRAKRALRRHPGARKLINPITVPLNRRQGRVKGMYR